MAKIGLDPRRGQGCWQCGDILPKKGIRANNVNSMGEI